MRLSRVIKRAAALAAATMFAAVTGATATAAPTAPVDPITSSKHLLASPTTADGSKILEFKVMDNRNLALKVYSGAMKQSFVVTVQRPANPSKPQPTLYLLNGAGGGVDSATWIKNTNVMSFLANHDVNVVQPIGGAWSYYADWRQSDPHLGVNKWQTYFTKELPPLIDAALGTNHVNAIAGLSTSGTSVLAMPESAPGLYRSVAAYSGCAQISDPIGQEFVKLAVETWGGGKTVNMYGAANDPMWAANDPYVHADKLRGLNLYISNGTGVPGMYDTMNGPHALPGTYGLADQIIVGGAIEAGVNYCAHNLQAKLGQLGIPATFDFQPTGTHSWGYWQDALVKSWPVLAAGLGIA